ncbi:MAG: hypothetical protein CBC09_06435 [Cellvibrionales bacterium TMED49]|nr:glutathione S-transferase [Porticoccaceae bacterium]OUU37897.1 MAG: hypothetical protein CBC09_06435 [Cellvibrionales bacterium TMED49]
MIILHGFSSSNYYNVVKHVLLHKNCEFQENKLFPKDPKLLEISATGKVPAITSSIGTHICETSVILDYIEDVHPTPSLYPLSSDDRALTRQLVKIIELYLEIPSRMLLPTLLQGREPVPEISETSYSLCKRGCLIINNLCSMSPYLIGAELTIADIFLRYALTIPNAVKQFWSGKDPLSLIEGLQNWKNIMRKSEISRKIDDEREKDRAEFLARF